MSSRSSLMFLSVNGTSQSYGVIPERSPIQGATPRMLLCRGMSPRADTQTRRPIAAQRVTDSSRPEARQRSLGSSRTLRVVDVRPGDEPDGNPVLVVERA